jgi:hypothetical protein
MTQGIVTSVGITELKELLVGVEKLSLILIKRFKDGVTAEDFTAIMSALATDVDFKNAVTGLRSLPAELKDINVMEGMEIGMFVMQSIPKYINAFK